jgi:hypothetical protein
MGVQELADNRALDSKIDVLRERASSLRDRQLINPSGYNANHVSAEIEERATAVSGLDRCRELKNAAVVVYPSKGRNGAGSNLWACRQ